MVRKASPKLTEEQQKLAEKNIKLVHMYMSRNNLDYDEWFDIILVGYTRAMAYYDPARGEVSTLAYTAMRNAHNMELRKRMNRINTVSLNSAFLENSTGDELCLDDIISDSRYTSEDSLFDYYLQQVLSSTEYEFIGHVINGMGQVALAKMLGLSQAQVSRILNKIRKKLKDNDCMYGRYYA